MLALHRFCPPPAGRPSCPNCLTLPLPHRLPPLPVLLPPLQRAKTAQLGCGRFVLPEAAAAPQTCLMSQKRPQAVTAQHPQRRQRRRQVAGAVDSWPILQWSCCSNDPTGGRVECDELSVMGRGALGLA
jgi:hypothetical protein